MIAGCLPVATEINVKAFIGRINTAPPGCLFNIGVQREQLVVKSYSEVIEQLIIDTGGKIDKPAGAVAYTGFEPVESATQIPFLRRRI